MSEIDAVAESPADAPAAENPRPSHRMCAQPPSAVKPLPANLGDGRKAAIRATATKWMNRTVLHYHFVQHPALWDWPPAQAAVVRRAFEIWQSLIGMKLKETSKESEAEILIGRHQGDGSWSWVGTEILNNRDLGRNMNFGWDLTTPWGGATALHEIGHALGLQHEHQNPLAGIVWDEEKVYAHMLRTNGWDRTTTYNNILAKLQSNTIEGSNWDPTSVMHYPFEPGLIRSPKPYDANGVQDNLELSAEDKRWAAFWYPPAPAAPAAITPMVIGELAPTAGEQRDFVFEPDATRDYTIETLGRSDARIVVFEERENEPRHLAAEDDAGTEDNARISVKLVDGRRYFIRTRIHYADGADRLGLLVR